VIRIPFSNGSKQIHDCTFGDLARLVTSRVRSKQGGSFHHLHLFALQVGQIRSTRVSTEDPLWKDLVIADALLASLSIPGLLPPHTLHFKDESGRHPRSHRGLFIDGGLSTRSLEAFDEKRYLQPCASPEEATRPLFNRRTLGLSLTLPSRETLAKPKTLEEFIFAIATTYLETEALQGQGVDYNKHRVIEIDGPALNLQATKNKALLRAGKQAASEVFKGDVTSSLFILPTLSRRSDQPLFLKELYPHFVGRSDLLKELAGALVSTKTDSKMRIRILHGPPGVGKSEAAIAFANKNLKAFSLVYTLDCRSGKTLRFAYLDLGKRLELRLDRRALFEEIQIAVLSELESHRFNKPWLLIYDNVQEAVSYPQRGGSVLITTTTYDLGVPKQRLEVKEFSLADTKRLLKKATGRRYKESRIKELMDALGGFPIVLDKAASYIAQEEVTIRAYLRDIQKLGKTLLLEEGSSRYSQSIEAAWCASFDRLQAKNDKAYTWLKLCAYFHPENIPKQWVSNWLELAYQVPAAGARSQAQRLIRDLKRFSLIRTHTPFQTLALHQTMQEVLRAFDDKATTYSQAARFIEEQGELFDADNPITWLEGQAWLPHAQRLTSQIPEDADIETQARIYYIIGVVENVFGAPFEALAAFRKNLEMRQALYGDKPHSAVAYSLNNVSVSLGELGQYKDALKYSRQALEINKTLYGDKPYPAVAYSLNNMGVALEKLRQHEEALDYFSQALEMKETLYGDKAHPDVAASLNNIGSALGSLGRHEEALKYDLQALEMRQALYGDKAHPQLAISLNNMGVALEKLRQHEEALKYSRQALEMKETLYGDKPHPDVATSLNNIGVTLGELGRHEEAWECNRKALEMRRALYEEKPYPDMARSLNNMGRTLGKLGRHEEAWECDREALEIRRALYEEKPHPDMARSLNNMGTTLGELGRHEEALDYFSQALEMNKTLYGDKPHPGMARSLNNMGFTLEELGRDEKALDHHRQALEMNKTLYGDKPHPLVAESLHTMGVVFGKLDQYEKALEYFNKALTMFQFVHKNNDHSDIIRVLKDISELEQKTRQAEQNQHRGRRTKGFGKLKQRFHKGK